MDYNRLTDSQIVQALTCCILSANSDACIGCPLDGRCEKDEFALEKSALELISRQSVEIEKSRMDAVSEYIESVKYEFCMTNGLEENRKIFEVLDRIGDKYAAQKASEEA